MVGNCVFGAPVVIGSRNLLLCCEKVEKRWRRVVSRGVSFLD